MPYQVLLGFRQFGATWTETFYSDGVSQTAILDNFTNFADRVYAFRHPNTVFEYVVARNVNNTRDAAPREINQGLSIPSLGFGSNTPDIVQVTAPLTITAPNGPSRKMAIRGLPDNSTLRNPINGNSNTAALLAPIMSYYGIMTISGGCIRHSEPATQSGAYAWQNVVSIGADPDNLAWTQVTLVGASVLPAPGTTIYFRGFLNGTFVYLKGYFVVKSNTGTTKFSIGATFRESTNPVKVGNVQIRQHTWRYDPFSGASLGNFGTHKTSDPTSRRRGRRSKGIRRQLTLVASP